MKKTWTVFTAMVMAAACLASCGSSSTGGAATTSAETEAPSTAAETTAAAAESTAADSEETTSAEDEDTSSEAESGDAEAEDSSEAGEEEADESAEAEDGSEDFAQVADGKLTVGFDAEYPPYGFMDDDGEYTGFDLELAEAICEKNGWELEKKPINWDSKDLELNSGSIDCIWNGFTMTGREDEYTFSIPYVDNTQVIVVAEDGDIKSLADLSGKIVGVQEASAALELLEGDQKDLADTFAALNQFANYNTAFTELQAGALDALAIDVGVARYQINSRGEGFIILDEDLNSEQYAVGFKKGSEGFAELINQGLCELAVDGTIEELAKKYEKYDLPDMISLTKEAAEEYLQNKQ